MNANSQVTNKILLNQYLHMKLNLSILYFLILFLPCGAISAQSWKLGIFSGLTLTDVASFIYENGQNEGPASTIRPSKGLIGGHSGVFLSRALSSKSEFLLESSYKIYRFRSAVSIFDIGNIHQVELTPYFGYAPLSFLAFDIGGGIAYRHSVVRGNPFTDQLNGDSVDGFFLHGDARIRTRFGRWGGTIGIAVPAINSATILVEGAIAENRLRVERLLLFHLGIRYEITDL